jgi:CheY-like chemotaxis protein
MSAVEVSHKRILLIDDNPVTREAVSMMLAAAGYCVALANNGADALRRLHEHRRPDLILLDLSMPVLDGHDFRRRQQEDEALASIPVIILSGIDGAAEEATMLGVAGYLHKPVEAGRLLEAIHHCCETKAAVG